MFVIVDGGHNGGNEDVFFLEPLTDFDPTNPDFTGDLNLQLEPTARVCQLNATETNPYPDPLECLDGGHQDDLPMSLDELGFYRADLKDVIFEFNLESMYRIEIRLASLSLNAVRDIDPDDGPATASCTSEDYCQFNANGAGQVPIKVYIENNAACLALDPTFDPQFDVCTTATLNAGETLVAQKNGETIAAATPNTGATLSIQSCPDLRTRGSKLPPDQAIAYHASGRVDLMTWGPCLEFNALDAAAVAGVTELCDAPFEALANDLDIYQVNRLTIHQHHVDDPSDPDDEPTDEFTLALGHAEGAICEGYMDAPQQNGQVYQFTKMQKLARAIRSTWRTVSSHISELIQPEALTACNRGCSTSGGYRTSYQVAGPAWWEPDPILGLDLGTHDQGTPVTAKANVWDSGEFDAGGPLDPDPYEGLRVTVTLNGDVQDDFVYSDASGVVEFSFPVQAGPNTVKFEAIGVGSADAPGTVNNVYAPSMVDPAASPVALNVGELTFTAYGRVPIEFTQQPRDIHIDASTDWATLTPVTICTVGEPVVGYPITSIVAVTNNGSWVELTGETFPQDTELTAEGDACVTFDNLQINKTGSNFLVAEPVYNDRNKVVGGDAISEKWNTRPPDKKS
jgi:hypothetical protein